MHIRVCTMLLHMYALSNVLSCNCTTLNQSVELMKMNLENSYRRIRPTLNQSRATQVYIAFSLNGIHDFDEVNGKFAVSGSVFMSWTDESIQWDPIDHGKIQSQVFPAKDVWYPKVTLLAPFDTTIDIIDDNTDIRISYTGMTFFAPTGVFTSTCKVDVTHYPFDTQTCELVFTVWDRPIYEVKLKSRYQYVLGNGDTAHGEWAIVQNKSRSGDYFNNKFTVTFTLKRRPLFVLVNIIIPIMLLAVLNTLVFALPPESGERISYATAVLLSTVVFLTVVGDNLPKMSENMSALSYFLAINLTTSTLICIIAILNLRLFYKPETEMVPDWLKRIMQISRCSFSSRMQKAENSSDAKSHVKEKTVIEKGNDEIEENSTCGITCKDGSKFIDKICLVAFSLITVVNSTGFILVSASGLFKEN